jgi:hypothetical protein
VVVCGCVWLYVVSECGCVWLLWMYGVVCGCGWLCVELGGSMWLYVIVCGCRWLVCVCNKPTGLT